MKHRDAAQLLAEAQAYADNHDWWPVALLLVFLTVLFGIALAFAP